MTSPSLGAESAVGSPGRAARAPSRLLLREHLRRGAEAAIRALGVGFIAHPENHALRAALQSGGLTAEEYFEQLLRLVHRLVFSFVAEERNLLRPDVGLRLLCDRAREREAAVGSSELWRSTSATLRDVAGGTTLGTLEGAALEDRAVLEAAFELAWVLEGKHRVRVAWDELVPEELGAVYESLLELKPQIVREGRLGFALSSETTGHARRTTGSYYTPDDLVQVLLDSALEPAVADAIAAHPEDPVEALLRLTLVDPACGSGHFLLAAARRLAGHVARLRVNGAPSASEHRRALGEVVKRCVHGVDLNPVAVELCRLNLWLELAEPGLSLDFLDARIQRGNALLGASPHGMRAGIPNEAWEPGEGDDKKTALALKKQNKQNAVVTPTAENETPALDAVELDSEEYQHRKRVADTWCAAWVWPKRPGAFATAAPTNARWRRLRDERGCLPSLTTQLVSELAERYRFFHWELQFPWVFARGGFDVVLGNPPWIAHAGRAAQPLPSGVRRFYEVNYEAFADYPTTHGMFASVMPRVLRAGGRLGLVIPASLSELGGYAPTRTAHDRLCEFTGELTDFGEGRFSGVTQPCMALVSRRTPGGRKDAERGAPWPMARPDLSPTERALLERLASLPTLPAALFGERGLQSDKRLRAHFLPSAVPSERFTTPIREGTDVREFALLPPRHHVDRASLGNRLRPLEEFAAVRVVVRQTARYPIAALSDGVAFRNSLLAVFDLPEWPAEALVALLNSALVRWAHYVRFRDARQPVMPQVKIAHLRAIPAPELARSGGGAERVRQLAALGERMSRNVGPEALALLRFELDALVAELYDLSADERAAVASWHQRLGPKST